ncbi:MAG: hypothetical protein HYT46_03240 [Candidatus Vogelbacteria bacterium]|nr:hypothetical protein [Candidatus Vogelbacteria bacterium]
MTIATYNKLKTEIKRELIEEFITPILSEIKDPEGSYKVEFVNSVLRIANEKTIYRYHPKEFLRILQS